MGGKAPVIKGAMLSSVIVPFMKMEPPYTEVKELLRKIWEWWDENGKTQGEGWRADRESGVESFPEGRGAKAGASDDQPTKVEPLRVLLIGKERFKEF